MLYLVDKVAAPWIQPAITTTNSVVFLPDWVMFEDVGICSLSQKLDNYILIWPFERIPKNSNFNMGTVPRHVQELLY